MREAGHNPGRKGTEMFLVFGGAVYYPRGGWHDFLGKADTLEEAHKLAEPYKDDSFSWWHIVDAATLKVVEEGP